MLVSTAALRKRQIRWYSALSSAGPKSFVMYEPKGLLEMSSKKSFQFIAELRGLYVVRGDWVGNWIATSPVASVCLILTSSISPCSFRSAHCLTRCSCSLLERHSEEQKKASLQSVQETKRKSLSTSSNGVLKQASHLG